jgi:hypothetical protein
MDVLVVTLTTFTLCARLLDRIHTGLNRSTQRVNNIHAIYVLLLQKVLSLYYAWQLLGRLIRNEPWDESDWDACAKAM